MEQTKHNTRTKRATITVGLCLLWALTGSAQPMVAVQHKGLWGFADATGSLLVPHSFDSVKAFYKRVIAFDFTVYQQNKQGLVIGWTTLDSIANTRIKHHVIPPLYDSIKRTATFIKAYRNNGMAVFDYYGNPIFPLRPNSTAYNVYVQYPPYALLPNNPSLGNQQQKSKALLRKSQQRYASDKRRAQFGEQLILYNNGYYRVRYQQDSAWVEPVKMAASMKPFAKRQADLE
jgi:hypothetical protein